ncbi:DNA-deoxyinosine glycosylase [Rhodococcus sp. MEB064]|uniref:DNA-deoxyinosine glycosylase n=1 Tax=Rhodococcus sp. MEB064 TaxID=1587522 RepID=UPI0005AC474F|nr:DNA-deoxyinosine glycosylase [Rhodococcus sp. MEB064]KIQ19664.1 DNA glycosylase [Rhodococcus sp. MEB064]
MTVVHSFAPLVGASPHTLLLGSMPGVASLRAGQYYAHPRNAFWPIMAQLVDFRADDPYDDRVAALTASGIAVWDVLELCTREGSLDSAIDADTAVANDLAGFVTDHPTVRRIFLNGAAAEKLFLRHVRLPRAVACRRLPSTSPAHASSTLAEKTEAWRVVMEVSP